MQWQPYDNYWSTVKQVPRTLRSIIFAMSSHNPPVDGESTQLYELFEEALELLARGASYDAVLAKCPPQQREELRKNVACAAFVRLRHPPWRARVILNNAPQNGMIF